MKILDETDQLIGKASHLTVVLNPGVFGAWKFSLAFHGKTGENSVPKLVP